MKKCSRLVQEKAVLEEENLKARRQKKEKYNRNRNYSFMESCLYKCFLIQRSSAFLLWGKQERNLLKHLKFGRSQHFSVPEVGLGQVNRKKFLLLHLEQCYAQNGCPSCVAWKKKKVNRFCAYLQGWLKYKMDFLKHLKKLKNSNFF